MPCTRGPWLCLALPALALLVAAPVAPAGEPAEKDAVELVARLGGTVYRDRGPIARVVLPGKETRKYVTGVVIHDRGSGRKLSDSDVKTLAVLTRLEVFDLSGTGLSDQGVKYLAGLGRLKTLGLARTQVTDAGLKDLKGLKDLQSLDLTGTRVTEAGVAQLQRALPRCRITR